MDLWHAQFLPPKYTISSRLGFLGVRAQTAAEKIPRLRGEQRNVGKK